jgi:hypothetical protein
MLNKKLGLIALLASLVAGDLFAGNLTNYAVGDVLLCFRKSGGANDLVVDVGPVSTFTNATMNQRIPITSYSGTQLSTSISNIGTNNAVFSAFTWYDNSVSPAGLQWTLFISKGRTSPYAKSSAWSAARQNAQLLTGGDMSTIVPAVNLSYKVGNTSSAVVEPDDTTGNSSYYPQGASYDYVIQGPNTQVFNFYNNWSGNPEITAPANFTTSGNVIRSDFYQIPPSDQEVGSVKFLGYFEFNTNGLMTYVAYPTAPTVTTLAASNVTAATAQLNATVNPNAEATTLYFQYGLTPSYGSTTGTNIIGTTSGTYGLPVSGLAGGSTYHFRAVAYNYSGGTNYGSDLTFTTTGGGAVVAPVIKAFSRSNGVSYVSFSTGNSGTYTLRGTNSAGVGGVRTNWPAIASVSGNGQTNTLQDTTSSANKFYLISAQ